MDISGKSLGLHGDRTGFLSLGYHLTHQQAGSHGSWPGKETKWVMYLQDFEPTRTWNIITYGGVQKWGYPKIDGLQGKILLKWMIWEYHYVRKPPYYDHIFSQKDT